MLEWLIKNACTNNEKEKGVCGGLTKMWKKRKTKKKADHNRHFRPKMYGKTPGGELEGFRVSRQKRPM